MIHAATPAALRQQLNEAEQALSRQDYEACLELCEAVLNQDRINLPAHLYRGVAASQLGQLDRAVADLQYVLERDAGNLRAALFLGQALRRDQQFAAAVDVLRPLAGHHGLGQPARFELALSLDRLGEDEAAIDTYRALLANDPRHADAAANLAALLERTDRLDEALAWVDRALVQAPKNTAAQLTRARILVSSQAYTEALAALEALQESRLSALSQVIVLNQMGRCLEGMERYEEAFDCYHDANEIQRANDPEAAPDDYASYGVELAVFLRQWLQAHPPGDWSETPEDDREPPVFLLGFPLSGHSGLEAALASHPHVEMIQEKELMLEVRRQWISMERFDRLHQMNPDEVRQARHLYRTAVAGAFQNPDARVVIDRLPLNSMWVALIHRLFPDARIIRWVRDPRDVCIDCYFQTFQLVGAMPYFLGLDSTTRYYDTLMSLMQDAQEALPLNLHEWRFESAAGDAQASLDAVLQFLDLEPGSVSADNVTSDRAGGRWRHHAEALVPWNDRVEPWVKRFGYPAV